MCIGFSFNQLRPLFKEGMGQIFDFTFSNEHLRGANIGLVLLIKADIIFKSSLRPSTFYILSVNTGYLCLKLIPIRYTPCYTFHRENSTTVYSPCSLNSNIITK